MENEARVSILPITAHRATAGFPAFMAARIIISLLQNPLNGGIPDIDNAPTSDANDVTGIFLTRFPIFCRSLVPVEYSILPDVKNNNDLNTEWFNKWKETRIKWHKTLALGEDNYKFHDHDKLAHYANAATDIEFKFPIGFKELEGIHSRTDFDLSSHQEFSGKKLQYFDGVENKSYVPYVIETSIGLDRMFLSVLSSAFTEEEIKKENGKVDKRVVLKIPPALAPVKLAIFPLIKKDGLPEKAREIMNSLKYDFNCQYEEKDTIGKRYRRQDAIGTPYCITIDHDTLKDKMVTIRDRDTMEQERIEISKLSEILDKKVNMKYLLEKL